MNPLRIYVGDIDVTPVLLRLAEEWGLTAVAPSRISLFLIMQLLREEQAGNSTRFRVLDEISALEGQSRFPSGMRAPTLFNHKPLKGLWHKHFRQTDIRSLSMNLVRKLKRDGLPTTEAEADALVKQGDFETMVARITHEAVIENYERLVASQSFTGEWIVYAVHEGANYYLCLAAHDTGDNVVFDWINTACTRQFPFLIDQLKAP